MVDWTRGNTCEVYKISCPNGVYVGLTTLRLKTRWSVHLNKLKRGKHPCSGLQLAYDAGYQFEQPESLVIFRTKSKASAQAAERFYQLKYHSTGELMNTRIEKVPDGLLCKHGKFFLSKSKTYGG